MNYEEATPESGTGKYYKHNQPTKKQLEVRKTQDIIRKHGSVEAYNRKMNK